MAQVSRLVWRASDVPEELGELLATLGEEYPVSDFGRGLKLQFRRVEAEGTLSRVVRTPGAVRIEYNSIAAAARGIGSALAKLDGEETTPFKTLGIMLDVSRNMVMSVEHLKMWFRRLALSGCNMVMLYVKDAYLLEGEPYFGCMRGAYTREELREIDACARELGIEMVASIQTLGHLEPLMRWSAYAPIHDTGGVILAEEPASLRLLEKMISFWSEVFPSRRIHLGMDEAHGLGRGRYLSLHG